MTTPTRDHKVARSYEASGTEFDTAGANGRLDPLDLIPGPFTATDTQLAIEEVMERVLPASDPWDETSNGSITAKLLNDWSTKRFYHVVKRTEPDDKAYGNVGSYKQKFQCLDLTDVITSPEFMLDVNGVSPLFYPGNDNLELNGTAPLSSSAKIILPGPAIYKISAKSTTRKTRGQLLIVFGDDVNGQMPSTHETGATGGTSITGTVTSFVDAIDQTTINVSTAVPHGLTTSDYVYVYSVQGDAESKDNSSRNTIRRKIYKVLSTPTENSFSYRQKYQKVADADDTPGAVIVFYKIPNPSKMISGMTTDPSSSTAVTTTAEGVVELTESLTTVTLWQYFNGNSPDANGEFGLNLQTGDLPSMHREIFIERIG